LSTAMPSAASIAYFFVVSCAVPSNILGFCRQRAQAGQEQRGAEWPRRSRRPCAKAECTHAAAARAAEGLTSQAPSLLLGATWMS